MDALLLARWQFAITTIYHFFFVPLTLGLSIIVAIMETVYVKTGREEYKQMTQFWGKLFLINFAMGVVTGIVQEFQFGMNWSEYSRFVGDIFGAPLAVEALLAFFLESTFLGIWIFGWERLSKKLHAATLWIVAFSSNLSALWILIANSFMQQPVGYTIRNGRAEMTDFFALLFNGHVWVQFPHVFFSALCTAGFFIVGISAYHLLKKSPDVAVFRKSFKAGTFISLAGVIATSLVGHNQAQYMVKIQPMKMAAAEALWEDENPAAMSLFTIGNEKERKDVFAIRVPRLLSILAYNKPTGMVRGINSLQAEYENTYGPGNYVPPVAISYWSFRLMIGAGGLMLLLSLVALLKAMRNQFNFKAGFLKILLWSIALPYIANTTGWIFTEIARQPWAVFGVMTVKDAVSTVVSPGEVLFSLIAFTSVYGILMGVDIFLLKKYARLGTSNLNPQA